ncbi:MAG: hypothetical protein AAFQ63_19685 [Cyanobacteria bacterium J06621_11]
MKNLRKRVGVALLASVTIGGLVPLAQQPASAQRFDNDDRYSYCDRRARDEARRVSGGVIGGAIEGSIRGAIIGGIFGGRDGARRGSRAGGALGGIGGGIEQERRREDVYRREFDNCMYRER